MHDSYIDKHRTHIHVHQFSYAGPLTDTYDTRIKTPPITKSYPKNFAKMKMKITECTKCGWANAFNRSPISATIENKSGRRATTYMY